MQDVVAGDGTTSVVVICGALLKKCQDLLEKGVHPTVISDSFSKAAHKACEVRPRVWLIYDLGGREFPHKSSGRDPQPTAPWEFHTLRAVGNAHPGVFKLLNLNLLCLPS
jgi:T-complex protein 1 subunit delta